MADLAETAAPDGSARDFADSQRDGLAAAIGLARAETVTTGQLVVSKAEPEQPPAPPCSPTSADAGMPAPNRQEATLDSSATASCPPAISDSLATVTDDGPQPAATKRTRKLGLSWSSSLACLEVPLLIAILTVQAILSLRLVWSNTAFYREAIDLSAGHVEIESLLHGTPLPAYATYFSGSPIIYPPIGAIADSIGGLAGARILSLLFMLGATSLLWRTTSRLFGKKAGVCAAALFAVLGPSLQLGALATFDAMAVFLLAASACCMVASRNSDDSALSLVAGTILLALANATTYSTVLFDAPVIALAGLTVAAKGGKKAAAARSGYVAAGTIGLIGVFLAIGGSSYLSGFLATTISPQPGNQPAQVVLMNAWRSSGLLLVIAAIGLILCALWHRGRVHVTILAVLVLAGLLAPLAQAIIHNTMSLSTHVDFGSWFLAIAAGYAITQVSEIGRWKPLRLAVAGVILMAAALPSGIAGSAEASQTFEAWPNSERVTTVLLSLTRIHPGRYLAEDDSVPAFYLENSVRWQQWSGTSYFRYRPPGFRHSVTGLAAYRAAISHHYFSLVILDFVETAQTDGELIADMDQAGGYEVVAVVPSSLGQYTIWVYEPRRLGGAHGNG